VTTPPRPGHDGAPAGDRALRVVVAPDSFKGTADAEAVAAALATGWRSVRPADTVIALPQADGGEGTARILAGVLPSARWVEVAVTGPDGRPAAAGFALAADGTAVVDLASASGIGLMAGLDPLHAQTTGLGQLLAQAVAAGATRIVAGLGGSASTDGGLGALRALGLRALDAAGRDLPQGGLALARLAAVDRSALVAPPSGGVDLLVDVTAPLLGPAGAAAVFGPQKGADPAQITLLEAGLARLAEVLGGDPAAPGAGAAGGTGYGLATVWGARFVPGAARVAELTGLAEEAQRADVVLLGEGRLDATSLTGKVVGHALDLTAGVPRRCIVAGQVALDPARLPGVATVSLADLAGGVERAMADPLTHLVTAGARLARDLSAAPRVG